MKDEDEKEFVLYWFEALRLKASTSSQKISTAIWHSNRYHLFNDHCYMANNLFVSMRPMICPPLRVVLYSLHRYNSEYSSECSLSNCLVAHIKQDSTVLRIWLVFFFSLCEPDSNPTKITVDCDETGKKARKNAFPGFPYNGVSSMWLRFGVTALERIFNYL